VFRGHFQEVLERVELHGTFSMRVSTKVVLGISLFLTGCWSFIVIVASLFAMTGNPFAFIWPLFCFGFLAAILLLVHYGKKASTRNVDVIEATIKTALSKSGSSPHVPAKAE
jgi:hypothetical protein